MESIYIFLLLAVSGFATANFLFENEDDDNPQFAPRLFNAENPTGPERYSMAIVKAIEYNVTCTASIISKRVLISGAKFFTLYTDRKMKVYFPSLKFFKPKTFDVKKVHLHPNFTNLEKYHDIALIVMKMNSDTDEFFDLRKPIPLLTKNDIVHEGFVFMTVLGFGVTDHKHSFTNEILKSKAIGVDTDIVDLAASILVFKHGDLSYGDSGAPLIMNGILVGVAAYTDAFKEGFPSIFTGIPNHYDWIEQKLQEISASYI